MHAANQTVRMILLLCLVLAWLAPAAIAQEAESAARQREASEADLARALTGQAEARWAKLPDAINGVRVNGPISPQTGAGQTWFLTRPIDFNSHPRPDARQEAAFRESVEAAWAGETRVIVGGEVLLRDPQGRLWAVAEHMPHLLRCYDGEAWTYRRADGLPAADDEPEAFLTRNRGRPKSRYAADGLRDLDDLGRWFGPACADAAGDLHFVGGCRSEDAQRRGVAGGGVHTLRPDGSWSFFAVLPVEVGPNDGYYDLAAVRFIPHAAGVAGEAGGGDLVTLAALRLSDPAAKLHGMEIEPIPAPAGTLRAQGWQDFTDKSRYGPEYLFRFDGQSWRAERSAVGWGTYDDVWAVWPQPDGRAYLANRFGLWVQWPEAAARARLPKLIEDLFSRDDAVWSPASRELVQMGRYSVDALVEAEKDVRTDLSRRRVGETLEGAKAVATGEEGAVPLIGGRWRFFKTYPQATMPDGRFAFHCERAEDVVADRTVDDCVVFFDPADNEFTPVAVDREDFAEKGFDARPNESLTSFRPGGVIDADGALWISGGRRFNRDGRMERLAPAGLSVREPEAIDAEQRVYFPSYPDSYVYIPSGASPASTPATSPATRPAEEAEPAERLVTGVRALFRQPDLPPPWNGWAVAERGGKEVLLRLDGPEPTAVELPAGLAPVAGVVPLDGGCVAARPGAAGFWDGQNWDVADDVRTLVERHGKRLAKMASTRVFAADMSGNSFNAGFDYWLLLASDGAGGLWLAEDRPPVENAPRTGFAGRARRDLWHWDGEKFADLWSLLGVWPRREDDGPLFTADGGRALVVQIAPDGVKPGAWIAVWNVTADDLQTPPGQRARPPQGARESGPYPVLLAALGPNNLFQQTLWPDRQGWLWSPMFGDGPGSETWARQYDSLFGGDVAIPQGVRSAGQLTQGASGPVWVVADNGGGRTSVWVELGEATGESVEPSPRDPWAGAVIDGMGAAARVVVAPDGTAFLLHEGGLSQLAVRQVAGEVPGELRPMPAWARFRGGRPPMPVPWRVPMTRPAARFTTNRPPASQPARPAVIEVARRPWATPHNSFGPAAFDATGVWFLPDGGPLLRVSKPVACAPTTRPAPQ